MVYPTLENTLGQQDVEAMCTMCTCSGSEILKNGEFDSFLILQAIYFVEKCEVMFSIERLKT